MIGQVCQVFVASLVGSKSEENDMFTILVVLEFPHVFPKKLLVILLEREVEFSIDLNLGTLRPGPFTRGFLSQFGFDPDWVIYVGPLLMWFEYGIVCVCLTLPSINVRYTRLNAK